MTVIMSNLNRFKHFLQERGGLMHFARLANTPLKVEESDETITFLLVTLPCIFRFRKNPLTDSAINLS